MNLTTYVQQLTGIIHATLLLELMSRNALDLEVVQLVKEI